MVVIPETVTDSLLCVVDIIIIIIIIINPQGLMTCEYGCGNPAVPSCISSISTYLWWDTFFHLSYLGPFLFWPTLLLSVSTSPLEPFLGALLSHSWAVYWCLPGNAVIFKDSCDTYTCSCDKHNLLIHFIFTSFLSVLSWSLPFTLSYLVSLDPF